LFDLEQPLLINQETQTDVTDSSNNLKTNAELCAEIEKLNRFRKKVEESTKPTPANIQPAPMISLSDCDSIERRHLKFYQERMRMLECKLEVFESSGEVSFALSASFCKLLNLQISFRINQSFYRIAFSVKFNCNRWSINCKTR